jgi:hypothetical protein
LKEEDIVEVEKVLNFSLPIQYRSFLLKQNGGHPQPNKFNIEGDPENISRVDGFNYIKNGDFLDLLNTWEVYQGRIPKEFISIAFDPGGNQICIGVSNPYYGQIYFWDHEEEGDEETTYDNLYLIAESFDKFMNNLSNDY